VDATWAVFFIPAAILIVWVLLDWWLIKDTPEEADFPHFDTHDASSGQMHIELTHARPAEKSFCQPADAADRGCIGLTGGIFRNGMTQWYFHFCRRGETAGRGIFPRNIGAGFTCIFGIVGGFAGGLISDRWFQSRRGPPAALLCGFVLMMTVVMAVFCFPSPLILGWAAVLIVMASVGITSLMSGTAATDFGGRKATATCIRHRGRLCLSRQRHPVLQPRHPQDGADESSRSRNLTRLKQIISGTEIISPPLTFSPVDLVPSNFGKRLFAFFSRQDNGTETKTIRKGNKL
jgi:uncharacterized membrane protein YeaQ/YmgE (transglycosylase-associated protein family)